MFSIKQKKYYLAVVLCILAAFVLLYLRFQDDGFIHNKKEYLDQVGPRLNQVIADPSAINLQSFEDYLLSIKSADRSIGSYHLPLYMAFVLWSKYLDSGNIAYLEKSQAIFEELKITLPEFSTQFEQIIMLIKKNV